MDGGWRRTGQACAGVVIADGFNDAGHHGAHHADHARSRHGRDAPLDCRGTSTETPTSNVKLKIYNMLILTLSRKNHPDVLQFELVQ